MGMAATGMGGMMPGMTMGMGGMMGMAATGMNQMPLGVGMAQRAQAAQAGPPPTTFLCLENLVGDPAALADEQEYKEICEDIRDEFGEGICAVPGSRLRTEGSTGSAWPKVRQQH